MSYFSIELFFLVFFTKIVSSSLIFINESVSSQGNGTLDFPYISFDLAFNLTQNVSNEYYLLSSQSIKGSHNFSVNTTIIGSDQDAVTLRISQFISIINNLTITNLTISSNMNQSNAIIVFPGGSMNLFNCKITNLYGSGSLFVFFKISSLANLTWANVYAYNIDNPNLVSIIDSGMYSSISIVNSNFFNISIDNTQLLTANMSILLINSSYFNNINSSNISSSGITPQAFLFLFNTKTILLSCNFLSSFFFSFPLIEILHELPTASVIDNSFFEIQMIGLQFSQLTCSNKLFIDSFIMISAISLSIIEMQFLYFLEMTSDVSLITIIDSNFTKILNTSFFMTTTNRNLNFINCMFVEMKNCTFFVNNLNILSLPLESTLMLFEDVYNKTLDSIFVSNCSSYWTTPVIKIISKNGIESITQISNSLFSNNRLLYQNNNEGGCVLYVNSQNEHIFLKNSVFDSNLVLPLQYNDRIGAPCAKLKGDYLNISVIDSIFKNNQAVFGCNCIEFDGIELKINNSIFYNNRNYLVPKTKDDIPTIGNGGSIYSIGQNLFINNSQFEDNMNYFGGNIYFEGNMLRKQIFVDVDRCKFINNYAQTFGSVFYFADKIKHLRFYLAGCLFYRDWANYNAAIFMNYNSLDGITWFTKSQFLECWSDFTPVFDTECLAGISYFINCSFLNNTASWFPRDKNLYQYHIDTDYGCGGVLGIEAKTGPTANYVYSENNVFSMNYAAMKGGVLITVGGNFTDNNSIFSNNMAGEIGSFHIHIGSMIQLNNSTIIDSFAVERACISLREFSYFFIYRSIFKNVFATYGKGLIYVDGLCELRVIDSIFENITSRVGNILYATYNWNASILFRNDVFKNNYNFNGEEMFYIVSSTNILFEGNIFNETRNRMFFVQEASLDVQNNIIESISCTKISQSGCVFYVSRSNITAENNQFLDVSSIADGSIYFIQNSIIQLNGEIFDSSYSSLGEAYTFSIVKSSIFMINCSLHNFYPGGLHSVNASILSLLYCDFYQTIFSDFAQNPSVYSEDSFHLLVKFSSFKNSYSYNGSALTLQCLMTNNILMQNDISFSTFSNNIADSNGGAIYIKNCPLQINSSNFSSNLAKSMGGAIFFEGSQNLLLSNIKFNNNTATEGGAIKYTDMPPLVDTSTIFQENVAIYGANIAAYPLRFSTRSTLSLIGRPSPTDSLLKNFSVIIIDSMNQTISTMDNQNIDISIIDFKSDKSIKLTGELKTKIIHGQVNISNIFFYCNITSDPYYIEISTSAIVNKRAMNDLALTSNEIIQNDQYIFRIKLKITNCSIGEIFDVNLQTCLICSNGRYSLNPISSSCEQCPIEAQSCYGNVISLKIGYWRSDVNSTKIYACQPLGESCLGGYLSQCATGYRGVLCQSCDVSSQIYSKSFGNNCVQCSGDSSVIILKLLSGSVALIIFYIFIIRSNLTLIDKLQIDETTGEIHKASREKLYSPIYNKILINYFQVVSLIKGIDLGWTSALSDLFAFQFIGGNAPVYLYSFDCLIDRDFPLPALYLKIILVFCTPILGAIIIYAFWLIQMKKNKIDISYKLFTSQLVLLNILQPTVVNMMSTILSCQEVNGISYLSTDLFFECYDRRNTFFSLIFAAPSLLFWVIIYPLLNLSKLIRSKHMLNKLEVRKKLGFLYNSYRIDYFYFDCVEIYRKYLLILIINYWQTNSETKSLIILSILGGSCYYISTKNPYLTMEVSKVAFLADVASLTTLFFGLLSFSTKDEFFNILGSMVTLFLNIAFLLVFTIKMMIIYRNKILKIVSASPFLKRFVHKFYENFARKTTTFLETRISRSKKVLNPTKKLIVQEISK